MPKLKKRREVEPYSREWLEAVHGTPNYKQWWLQEQLQQMAEQQKAQAGGKGEGEKGEEGKSKGGGGGSGGAGKGEISKKLQEHHGSGNEEDHDSLKGNPLGKTEVPKLMMDVRNNAAKRYRFTDKDRFLKDDTYFGSFKVVGDAPNVKIPDTVPYYKKKVAAAMIDNQFDREIKNQRKGALDTNALYKAYTGSDRVFRKKQEPKNKKYAIGFLYDKSGSMNGGTGGPAHSVVKTIYTVHEMLYPLQGMRIYEALFDSDFRLLSHPEWKRSGYEVAAKYAACMAPHMSPNGETDAELETRVQRIKEFVVSNFGKNTIQDFTTDFLGYDGGNNDGEALERMILWMSREDATVTNRILFVIGDGGVDEPTQQDVHNRIVPEALAKHNIKVVGISIGETELLKMYPDCLQVEDDASDLPEILSAKIASLVKRG